jgi:hypothetical protein
MLTTLMLRTEIGRFFELKQDPKIYLGARMQEVVLENGVKDWVLVRLSMFKLLSRTLKPT